MTSIIQVIILCTIFSFPSTTTVKDKFMSVEGLDLKPGLAILKDIDIWKDGEITSLAKMFGPDPEEWSCDSHAVAEMSFTALCCFYSSKILNFIQTIDNEFAKCEEVPHELSLSECWGVIKAKLTSMRTIAVGMLTTALNFTKIFNIRANKSVLNAFMSFYLFVNNIKDQNYKYSDENFHTQFINMKLYTRYLIEAFAVLNCSWLAYDVVHVNNIDVFDCEIPHELNLPETPFKQEHFNPNNLFLINVSRIPLSSDYNDLWGALEDVRIESFDHSDLFLKTHFLRYALDFHSEIITQSQTIVFKCIVSMVLNLINQIIITAADKTKTINSDSKAVVADAINVLKRLNFPGSSHVKLRKVLYHKIIRPNSYKPFKLFIEDSKLTLNAIEENLGDDKIESVKALTKMLKRFSNYLVFMEPEIKIVKEINQMLCDYEYEEVGFLQFGRGTLNADRSLTNEQETQAIHNLKYLETKNCEFSQIAVTHFILIDYIISQCETLLSDLNNLDITTQLESCFDSMIKSIRSIEDTLDQSLVLIIDILKSTHPHNNANRKVIDSILAMKLYFNNVNLLNSRVPQTAEKSVDVHLVVSKLDVLRRHNRFIVNLIEHYTVHNFRSQWSPRVMYTKEVLNKVNQQCSNFTDDNDKTKIIECVDKVIKINISEYEDVRSQLDRNDYTIENLLMNNILENALNENSMLSLLHELHFMWEGDNKRLTEIFDIVKNNINPKYLCKYQSIVIKAILFIAYEKIKVIIQSSTSNHNFLLYRSNLDRILEALNVINTDFLPLGIFRVYEMIIDYFQEYFQGDFSIDINALVRSIEVEQYYLGMQKESSGTMFDEIVQSIPDHTFGTSYVEKEVPTPCSSECEAIVKKEKILGSSSKSPELQITDSPEHEMYGQNNIDQLLFYLAAVEEIRTSLTNVALLLDLKRTSGLQI